MSWKPTKQDNLTWAGVFGGFAFVTGTIALLCAVGGAGLGLSALWGGAALAFCVGAMVEARS